jgi:hypothetical protein
MPDTRPVAADAGVALLNQAARILHRTLDVRRRLPDALAALGRTFQAAGAAVELLATAGGEVITWGSWTDDATAALATVRRTSEDPLLVPERAARPEPPARDLDAPVRDAPLPPGDRDPSAGGLRRPARNGAR